MLWWLSTFRYTMRVCFSASAVGVTERLPWNSHENDRINSIYSFIDEIELIGSDLAWVRGTWSGLLIQLWLYSKTISIKEVFQLQASYFCSHWQSMRAFERECRGLRSRHSFANIFEWNHEVENIPTKRSNTLNVIDVNISFSGRRVSFKSQKFKFIEMPWS